MRSTVRCPNSIGEAALELSEGGCAPSLSQFDYAALIIVIFLMLIGSSVSGVRAQQSNQQIATGSQNEFDLAQFCVEFPDLDDLPLPKSLFGYVSLQQGHEPDFAYISSQYYAEKGPDGFPHGCQFKRYLYRLNEGRDFRREEIDEKRFQEIAVNLQAYARKYRQLNPGKSLGLPGDFTVDSVGGCLFQIYWYSIGGKEYALLSLTRAGIVEFVDPDLQDAADEHSASCNAWGGRRLTNSSVTSTKDLAVLPVKADLLFIEWRRYQKGFLFKPGVDLQCVKAADAFSLHLLIDRKMFNAEMRPALERLLQKSSSKLSREKSDNGARVLTFAESITLNEQFANVVARIAKTKGCY